LISQAWGGLQKHIALIESVLEWQIPTSPKLDSDPPHAAACHTI
jgi:hypothetical protein